MAYDVAVLLAAATVFIALAYWQFQRRDLYEGLDPRTANSVARIDRYRRSIQLAGTLAMLARAPYRG